MRLLFDQNISFRVLNFLPDFFAESRQVRELGLENCSDIEIWQFAKQNNYAIVTFDADFYDLNLMKGHPPKIIWMRTGNRTTKNIAKILSANYDLMKEFLTDSNYKEIGCLEIF